MKKRAIDSKYYFLEEIDPVIRFLIISDTVMFGAVGLLGPIFALFIEDFIVGGNEATAGIAAGVYLFTKSTLQIPIANFIDRVRGEKDDYVILFLFTMAMSLIPLLYLFISTPLELYIVQFVLGLFTAFTFPTFMALFTHHVDRGKEGTEWGVYFTLTDITSAAFGALGGLLAATSGFPFLIITVVVLSVCGSLLLLPIGPYIQMPRKRTVRKRRTPRKRTVES
jgi:MFS family permease